MVKEAKSFVSFTNNPKYIRQSHRRYLSSSPESNKPPNKKPVDVSNAISEVMDMLAQKSGIELVYYYILAALKLSCCYYCYFYCC